MKSFILTGSERGSINGSVMSNIQGFKVPLFIGQGLLFLWAFSEKGLPVLFCGFVTVRKLLWYCPRMLLFITDMSSEHFILSFVLYHGALYG